MWKKTHFVVLISSSEVIVSEYANTVIYALYAISGMTSFIQKGAKVVMEVVNSIL